MLVGLAASPTTLICTPHVQTSSRLTVRCPTHRNAEMLRRTETAVSEGTDLTSGQRNFLDHEVLEGQLIADGVPQEVAHVVVLDVLPPGSNYDLDVLQRYSDQFNSSQFRYWGAEHPRGMP